MSVTDRIAKLRKLMEERKMDAYIIPSADNHQSEYVGEHFKARAFISGFTGSAGTVIITKDDAGLWTDGRYFIQAEKQLEGSGIRLFRMAEPDVPTKEEYLESVLPDHGVLGFDGKVIGASEGQNYEEVLKRKSSLHFLCRRSDFLYLGRSPSSFKCSGIFIGSCIRRRKYRLETGTSP